MIDENLKQWATDREIQFIDAVNTTGSKRGAARKLGIDPATIRKAVKNVERKAARQGYSPEHDLKFPVAEGYLARGHSTLYRPNGEVVLQWVKSARDIEKQQEFFHEAVKAFAETIPREKPLKAPKHQFNEDLLNCYVITDFHLGALAWHEEAGEDWDTDIAENLLVNWFAKTIELAPDSEMGIFAQLGDFLHFDSLEAVTPTNRHILDADTRFQRLIRVVIRSIRRVISLLLQKHPKVHLIMAEGNHDPASSIWLREWLHALYENEPRISVDLSPDPYYCYEHGKTSLFFHHGHLKKVRNIDDVFAAKFREIFGRTQFSYAHMGHLHHIDVKESNLMIVEQHRTLAAKDAFASRGGWMSGRDAKAITYSKKFGEIGRVVISPEMVDA